MTEHNNDDLVEQLRSLLAELRGPQSQPAKPAVPEGQLTRDDLKGMTPEAIDTARREGRLNHILGVQS